MGLILLIMFGPAILFGLLGIIFKNKGNKKVMKIFFILAGVYLLISLGTCGYLLATFELHP